MWTKLEISKFAKKYPILKYSEKSHSPHLNGHLPHVASDEWVGQRWFRMVFLNIGEWPLFTSKGKIKFGGPERPELYCVYQGFLDPLYSIQHRWKQQANPNRIEYGIEFCQNRFLGAFQIHNHNLIWRFDFKLDPIFAYVPADSKISAKFLKSGQKWPANNNLNSSRLSLNSYYTL